MSGETAAPAPPKRRWFQIHLSTALMLTILAGVLMAVNFSPQANKYKTYTLLKFGWPWTAGYRVDWVKADTGVALDLFGEIVLIEAVDKDAAENLKISKPRIAADVGLALLVLLGATFLFEWPIRRDISEKAKRQMRQHPRATTAAPAAPAAAATAGEMPAEAAPAPATPGRFQISIVSKMVLLLLSLALIAANLTPNSDSDKDDIARRSKYGFPWAVATRTNFVDADARAESLVQKFQSGKALAEEGWTFNWAMLPADLGVALGVLLVFLVVCEWAARSAFKPARTHKARGLARTQSAAARIKHKEN